MTRSARKEKKKHLDASSWNQLKGSINNGRVTKCNKGEKLSKDKVIKTMKEGPDLLTTSSKTSSKSLNHYQKGKAKIDGKTHNNKSRNMVVVDEKRLLMREKRKLRRAKMKECFGCRKPGHRLEDCPKRKKKDEAIGICFKCGSTEHGVSLCKANVPKGSYPFAKCFICGETGHLTRSCPDNPKGLYPHGGCCNLCGSVEHLKSNCPEKQLSKNGTKPMDSLVQVASNTTSADADTVTTKPSSKKQTKSSKAKIIKF